MKVPWRAGLLVSVIGLTSFAFVPSVAAQGGPGGGQLPAGTYHFTTDHADLFINATYPDPQLTISVTKNTQVSKPEVGPATTSLETDVYVSIQDYPDQIFGGGCYILDKPSDFSLSSDLTKATLQTTITSSTASCSGGSYLPPFSINAVWTGTGPVSTLRGEGKYSCAPYRSESSVVNTGNNASATATISLVTASFSSTQTGVGSTDQRIEASGVAPSGCQIGGKGAFAGFQPAGTYRNVDILAGASFGNWPDPSVGIFVSDSTDQAHPETGPATSTHEIDLNVQMFGGAIGGSGCWKIPAARFTSSGVSTATLLQVEITDQTPTCGFPGPSSFPLPFTVAATWTGTGPVVNLRDETTFKCSGYTQDVQSLTSSNNASVNATLTVQGSTSTYSGGQDWIVTGDKRIEAEGSLPSTCGLH